MARSAWTMTLKGRAAKSKVPPPEGNPTPPAGRTSRCTESRSHRAGSRADGAVEIGGPGGAETSPGHVEATKEGGIALSESPAGFTSAMATALWAQVACPEATHFDQVLPSLARNLLSSVGTTHFSASSCSARTLAEHGPAQHLDVHAPRRHAPDQEASETERLLAKPMEAVEARMT